MGQALYRKYRSKSLSEIIGQEHITDTLSRALESGTISHAYLFTGPRGVGKTSIARILAHEINGLPYTDDSTHMDIIEIDAASNRRIDEIRELRDKVHVAPTSAKYKVYIIDEVHMLTKEAFNALLKTLEEPPAHVVFILATTDAHKLPDTIVSRTQRYSFKPVETAKVVAHLRTIAISENIQIDDAALTLLSEHGEGSFRDSISMLDQARSMNDSLVLADVQSLLGVPPTESIEQLITSLASEAAADVMTVVGQMYGQGFSAAAIAKQIASALRTQLLTNALSLPAPVILELLAKLLEVPSAYDSNRFLELCLLQAVSEDKWAASVAPTPVPASEPKTLKMRPPDTPKIEAKKAALAAVDQEVTDQPKAEPVAKQPVKKSVKAAPSAQLDDADSWQQILRALKNKHNTLYGLVRMARPDFTKDGGVCLTFAFEFHRKRLIDVQNQQKLQDVIHEVTGKNLKIECIVDKDVKVPSASVIGNSSARGSDLASISNIFGGGELVE